MFSYFVKYKYIGEHILFLSLGPFYQMVVGKKIIVESTAASQDKRKPAGLQAYQVN
jgi:hypothetical protein